MAVAAETTTDPYSIIEDDSSDTDPDPSIPTAPIAPTESATNPQDSTTTPVPAAPVDPEPSAPSQPAEPTEPTNVPTAPAIQGTSLTGGTAAVTGSTAITSSTVSIASTSSDPGTSGKAIDPKDPITLNILNPQNNEVIPTNGAINISFELKNYKLKEGGNAIRVIVNNQPPITLYSVNQPLILKDLADGGQTIRAFAVRPDGSIIRDPKAYALVHFFIRKKDFQNYIDLTRPYLTVNIPSGDSFDSDTNNNLYVDVLLHNPTSTDNYKIHYHMDRYDGFITGKEFISWPHIAIGKHKVVFELLDNNGLTVFGPFNQVEREFEIRQALKPMSSAENTNQHSSGPPSQ